MLPCLTNLTNLAKLSTLLVLMTQLTLLSAGPAWSDVQNIEYGQKEIEVSAEGATAEEALVNCEQAALEDAIKPLVHTEEEQRKYADLRSRLMADRALYIQRLKIVSKGTTGSGGRFYKVLFRVEIGKLREQLVNAGVILSASQLNQELNSPVIVAYYHNPLDTGDYAQWSVERIHHYLLAHQFRVVDAGIWRALASDDELLLQGKGSDQRLGQVMALKAKADLVLEIEIDPKVVGHSGEYSYLQTPVKLRAFEASSGEHFIEKIYQRLNAKGQPEALAIKGSVDVSTKAVIEEAVAGVMPLMLADLTKHWKQHLVMGRQYRLTFRNLKPESEAELVNQLKGLVREVKVAGSGSYLVRYQGILGDLADELEARFGERLGLTLESFDLGNATFVCS